MGWRKKSFQKRIKRTYVSSPVAKELEEGQYRQRIKESDKDYKRQKMNVRNIDEYANEESSN
jgi:hypothetical protein